MGIIVPATFCDNQTVQGKVRIDVIDARGLNRNDLNVWLESWVLPDIPQKALNPPTERGRIVQTVYSSNLIVATGRAYLGLLVKGSTPAPTDVAVGTSDAAAADGDTTLGSETFRDNITQRINITNGARIRFILSSTASNGSLLAEAGIFGPSPNLYMLSRVTYTPISKTASVAVNYTWDISFTQP